MRQAKLFLFFGFLTLVLTVNRGSRYPQIGGQNAYFPTPLLENMMDRSSCDALRFYRTLDAKGQYTFQAVSVEGEGDMPVEREDFTHYQLFLGLQNDSAQIEPLDRGRAAKGCNALDSPWAVTIANKELRKLLQSRGSEGVELVPLQLSSGDSTLLIQSAFIERGRVQASPYGGKLVGPNPCPSMCGSNPAQNYLFDPTK